MHSSECCHYVIDNFTVPEYTGFHSFNLREVLLLRRDIKQQIQMSDKIIPVYCFAKCRLHKNTSEQGSRIPLSRCPGKVKSMCGIVQEKSVLTRRESQHMSVLILE